MDLQDFFSYGSFRPGQRELANSVHEACKKGEYLVAEAVSGFGKTAAILAGSLLAAQEDGLGILYACRTKRQISRVMEEISSVQSKRAITAVDISSKYDYCLLMRRSHIDIPPESFKWYCSFHVTNSLCSYFLNLTLQNHKATQLAQEKATRSLPHALLMQRSEQIHLCPYEVTRLALPNTKLIVTTYHYVFDEGKSLLFSNTQFEPSRTILIFDEAHNLRDFIRDASTITLSFNDLEKSKDESKQLYMERAHGAICTLKTRINDFCSASKNWHINKESFLQALCKDHDETWLADLSFELSTCAGVAWYSLSSGGSLPQAVLRVGKFLSALLACLHDEDLFLTRSETSLSILRVNSSKRFIETARKFKSAILLSATLGPSNLYLDSMSLPPSTIVHRTEASSSLQITTLLDLGVTTKFKIRSDEMYSRIASKILCAASTRLGGIGVFTSSYAVLNSLLPLIEKGLGNKSLFVESRKLSNQEAGEMMESFRTNRDSMLLAVQGGRFSEGEDFRGDSMSTSIVVGLSLPPPSPTLFAEYAYRGKSEGGNSYLVLSLLPALRKAFQSAGRHIRSPNKRGVVFLLDSRFNDSRIIDLMPSWLKQNIIRKSFSESEIQKIMRDCLITRAD